MRIESQLGRPGGSFCDWSAAPWTFSLEPGVSTRLAREAKHAASNTYTSPTSPGSAPSDSQSTLLYQHADHLTSRVTTDNSGNSSNAQAHYPYGENWYNTGTADPSPPKAGKFTSYRKETDSSLASGQINYAIARYHGARIGRFHRPDPVRGRISNPQRLNRYAYVVGDPTNRFDPRGTDDMDGDGIDDDDPWHGPDPPACGGEMCIMQDAPNMGTPGDAIFAAAFAMRPFDAFGSGEEGFPRASPDCVIVGQPTCLVQPVAQGLRSLGTPMLLMNTCSTCPTCVCLWSVPILENATFVKLCSVVEQCPNGMRTLYYHSVSSQNTVVGAAIMTTFGRRFNNRSSACGCEPPNVRSQSW
jgi:RHS repeat-associated protein